MTLKTLYAAMTGDTTSHQRRIDGHYRKLEPHRRAIIREKLAGASYRQIGAATGVTGASAQAAVRAALEKIRKAIAGEPRFNRVGKGPASDPRRPAARAMQDLKKGARPAAVSASSSRKANR